MCRWPSGRIVNTPGSCGSAEGAGQLTFMIGNVHISEHVRLLCGEASNILPTEYSIFYLFCIIRYKHRRFSVSFRPYDNLFVAIQLNYLEVKMIFIYDRVDSVISAVLIRCNETLSSNVIPPVCRTSLPN